MASPIPRSSPSMSPTTAPTTSPSLSNPSTAATTSQDISMDDDRVHAQRALENLAARVEITKLTRDLRARLSYASFKTRHNLESLTIDDLEREYARPTSSTLHSGHPAATNKRRAAPSPVPFSSSMPPPAAPSLYSHLLASPPAKRARHTQPQPLLPPPRVSPRVPHRTAKPAKPISAQSSQIILDAARPSSSTQTPEISAAAVLTSLLASRSPRAESAARPASVPSPLPGSMYSPATKSQPPAQLGDAVSLQPPKRTVTPPKRKQEDAVAAELMLFLATSPSPARPRHSTIMKKPLGAGRVLFAQTADDAPTSGETSQATLVEDADIKLPSSQETVATEVASGASSPTTKLQLLPPPPSPKSSAQLDTATSSGMATPKSKSFHLSEFLNVSPSPSGVPATYFSSTPARSPYRPSSLAATGRRLFEEDHGNGPAPRRAQPASLAASIDLVKAA